MKKIWLGTACAAALACGLTFAAVAKDAPDLTKAQGFGTWGFDLTSRDTATKPGDDFYRYSEGAATDRLEIPSDRSRYGSFDLLAALSEQRVQAVINKAAAGGDSSPESAQVGGYWRAYMDEATVEALDARPLSASLAPIRAAKSKAQLARITGANNDGFGSAFFSVGIQADVKDPNHYAVYLDQAGLGLPDRDYYLEPKFAEKKAAYQAYVAKLLTMAGWPDAEAQAVKVVAMETEIAAASWSRADQRDPDKLYNPMTLGKLATLAPGFEWSPYMAGAKLSKTTKVVVGEPTAFTKIAAIWNKTPLDTLQAWDAFHIADQSAPVLSKRFVDANFAFRGKTLSGQPEMRPRWKRAVRSIDGSLGETVGKLYVADYFPAESKAKMIDLVAELRASLANRIEHLDWMSPATKKKALLKLSQFTVKIGYPDKWRDYSALKISDKDLYGNIERSSAFEWKRQVDRLNGPVDKTEWGMTPQTVNAYYNPTANEIVFPAAILQPPFFDPNADMAINYGGIGAVIGHEMTHGFDDEGRKFDGTGALADWWAPEDATKFEAQTKKYGAQYSHFEALPGVFVNGDLTMGENIADLGGILMALDAYHMSLKGQPSPVIDGTTGDQRVFYGWAQVWRAKYRDDALKQQIASDPHSPNTARVNMVFHNVDAWYTAFDVKPGDKLYLAPADRVRIW
ncbi:MAG: peptidase [Caulobacter sp.]|nr:peptidase [Caulobacter sp.]